MHKSFTKAWMAYSLHFIIVKLDKILMISGVDTTRKHSVFGVYKNFVFFELFHYEYLDLNIVLDLCASIEDK